MPAPLISVIMPVRNGEKYIADALSSVLAQGMADIETIVVDDGSTDATCAIVEAHPLPATTVSRDSASLFATLNIGVAQAAGELVAILDHDDVWPEHRLARMLEGLEAHPAAGGIFGKVVNTDAELRPRAEPILGRMHNAMLVRRDVFATTGPFRTDLTHGANIDWISRAESLGVRFAAVDEVVLWRRIHADNMGVRDRTGARRDLLTVLHDHHRRTRRI